MKITKKEVTVVSKFSTVLVFSVFHTSYHSPFTISQYSLQQGWRYTSLSLNRNVLLTLIATKELFPTIWLETLEPKSGEGLGAY